MKTLFLGGFAAAVAPRILARVTTKHDTEILSDERDHQRLIPLLAEAEIVVGHIWRIDYPSAPRLRVLQSVTAGLDQVDLAAIPKGSHSVTSTAMSQRSPNTSSQRCWC